MQYCVWCVYKQPTGLVYCSNPSKEFCSLLMFHEWLNSPCLMCICMSINLLCSKCGRMPLYNSLLHYYDYILTVIYFHANVSISSIPRWCEIFCHSRNSFLLLKPSLCFVVVLRTLKYSCTRTVFSPVYLIWQISWNHLMAKWRFK